MSSTQGAVFILDWFEDFVHKEEIHAVAAQHDPKTGLYKKCLIRVPFPDFAYILFADPPESGMIERARRAVGTSAKFMMTKVKTIMGYQPVPTVQALLIQAPDVGEVLKNPAVKGLGGYVEEHTAISRSRKLTALRNMSQCCWVTLSDMREIGENDHSRLSKKGVVEYMASTWDKVKAVPLDSKESFTPPLSSSLKVLSFDIEVFKPSERGGGMPDPEDPMNFVLCISAVTHEQSTLASSGKRSIILHTIYDVSNPDKYLPDGTRIRRYTTEYEMIRGFWDNVAQEDPMLLLGFNVQSWDFRYLNARMKHHKITYPSSLSIYARPGQRIGLRKAHWSSEAFKHNDMLWPDIPGTVVLDLHKFYYRSRPGLRKHSLDFISRNYIGRGKYPVSQDRMVSAYESGNPDELSAMAQYNVEDSMLVLDLYLTQHIFEEAAIEAITSETLIDDLYTKGMQVRALNKIYRYAKEEGYVVTTSPTLSLAREYSGVEGRLVGALVQGSNPGRYDDVAVYDIRSMYPTLLMSKNVCYTTYLHDPSSSNTPEHQVYNWETKSGDPKHPHDVHQSSFVSPKVQRGICPRLLTDQMNLREKIKNWHVSGDPYGILTYVQKSVKAVSNSIIGLMGAAFESSRLSFPAAAGVIYTAARDVITTVIEDVSNWADAPHGKVVYSDTDSVLVSGMSSSATRMALLSYLNTKYSPFVFELETVGRLLLVGPKNYILRINEDGMLVYKGVTFSRRTSSDFVSQAMHEITEMIMNRGHSKAEIIKYLEDTVQHVMGNPLEAFAMSATVSTASSSVGGKLGRRLIAKGNILMPGDVVDYVVLVKPITDYKSCPTGEKLVQYTKSGKPKKVSTIGVTDRTATVDEVEKCFGPGHVEVVDFDYYIEKLTTSAQQLLVFD